MKQFLQSVALKICHHVPKTIHQISKFITNLGIMPESTEMKACLFPSYKVSVVLHRSALKELGVPGIQGRHHVDNTEET